MTPLPRQNFVCPPRNHNVSVRVVVFGLCATGLLAGCRDAAEPEFKRCEQLEAQGKTEEALSACQAARTADPKSPFGERATRLEIRLLDKLAAKKREKAAPAGAVDEAKVQEAEAKVLWVLESTPPKDKLAMSERCMAADRAYENAYSCSPKDPSAVRKDDPFPLKEECLLVAAAKGCKLLTPDDPSKYFCCIK